MSSTDFEAVMNGTYVEPIEEDDDDDEIVSEPVTETVTEAFETPEVETTQTFEDFTPAEDSTDNE